MGDLTYNLSRHEFQCRCGCGYDTVDVTLVTKLQMVMHRLEEKYGQALSILITGPNRCIKHNAKVGGAPNSQHIYARAADFKVYSRLSGQQISPEDVAKVIEELFETGGLGRYDNRTHYDTRTNDEMVKWDKRTKA